MMAHVTVLPSSCDIGQTVGLSSDFLISMFFFLLLKQLETYLFFQSMFKLFFPALTLSFFFPCLHFFFSFGSFSPSFFQSLFFLPLPCSLPPFLPSSRPPSLPPFPSSFLPPLPLSFPPSLFFWERRKTKTKDSFPRVKMINVVLYKFSTRALTKQDWLALIL